MTRLVVISALQASAIVSVGLAAATLLRRRSAALRHWVLAVSLGCAGAAPILGAALPSWRVPGLVLPPVASTGEPQPNVTMTFELSDDGSEARVPPATGASAVVDGGILAAVWLAGVVVSLATLGAGAWRLRALTARAGRAGSAWTTEAEAVRTAYRLRRPVRLLRTAHPTVLVAFGLRRHTVLLPAGARDWTAERIRIVVGHELAHAARGDWAIQLAAELLRSIYWFNPLVWLACRRLRQESEYACDDEVLRLGVGGTQYATHLVELAHDFRAHGRTWLPAPAMARPSTLRRRISAMLDARLNRHRLTHTSRAFVFAAVAAITLPVAAIGGQAFGTISGTVVDSTGGFMPNATLTLSNADTRAKHEVRSDGTGAFRFVGLPAGDYLLEVKTAGFADLRQDLTLAAGMNLPFPVTMQVGTLQETITVRGTPGLASPPAAPMRRAARASLPQRQCSPDTVVPPGAVGGNIKVPHKIVDVRPRYPESLQVQAIVVLDARIGTDGAVKDARAVSAVDPDVEQAAREAVMQWEFTPTLLNCVPIDVKMRVTVNFNPQ